MRASIRIGLATVVSAALAILSNATAAEFAILYACVYILIRLESNDG